MFRFLLLILVILLAIALIPVGPQITKRIKSYALFVKVVRWFLGISAGLSVLAFITLFWFLSVAVNGCHFSEANGEGALASAVSPDGLLKAEVSDADCGMFVMNSSGYTFVTIYPASEANQHSDGQRAIKFDDYVDVKLKWIDNKSLQISTEDASWMSQKWPSKFRDINLLYIPLNNPGADRRRQNGSTR